ncbi:hypothetical protein MLD38_024128 [Melastoma candidum]|uniref:Uncharacterized protein n=1 Tax=Melastoma candidum TaxID=119954 RepID=A0ACB9NS84_9MYRT|nr:hypothetical protein MLD38_024128 [Melastoma candidum]
MKSETMTRKHEPRSSSSCAACKLLKRRCTSACIFAPYFQSDEPRKFAKVHKVFGASNVSKILIEVPEEQREDAASSLAYEAEARLRDPVYGCIGAIALLHQKMIELQQDLAVARARLARYKIDRSSATLTFDKGFAMADFGEFPWGNVDRLSQGFGQSSLSGLAIPADDADQYLYHIY